MSNLQDRLWDTLDSATARTRIDTFGQPQAGRQTAHVIRDVFHTVNILLHERRRELTALPGLLAASKSLVASMDAAISLPVWADTTEPRPEIEALRIAVAQADAEIENDPT